MVGLDRFKDAFADFPDNYVIIGGTACDIVMANTIVRPRATHDIDMIVIIENMTPEFARRFWEFIKEAGYKPECRKDLTGATTKYELYRFIDSKDEYPKMIELLSRRKDSLGIPEGLIIEPLPISDDISAMSAIILDDDFYHFTVKNSMLTDGIRHASPIALIALKAKAYLNLISDKKNGIHVNSRNIKKHRSDVLKNAVIVEPNSVKAPHPIVKCIHDFVVSIKSDPSNPISSLADALDESPEFIIRLLDRIKDLFMDE